MSDLTQEEVYIEYQNYDWDSFSEFREGLQEILENYLDNLKEQDPLVTSIPPLDRRQLEDQAKCFFYCSHTGNILNLDDYEKWRRDNGVHYAIVEPKIQEIGDQDIETARHEVDYSEAQGSGTQFETKVEKSQDDDTQPPYSSNYQELVELIVSGKPIPGIKYIPNTVFEDKKSVSLVGQRRKPWEKEKGDNSEEQQEFAGY